MTRGFLSTSPRDLPSAIREKSGLLILGGTFAATLILWASAFVAIPIALESVAPVPTIISRLTLSSLFLFPILVRDWKKIIRPRFKKDFWSLVLVGFSGIFLYLIFLTYGQRTVGAGQTSFIINLTPLTAGILAALLLKEPFKKRMAFGALVSLLGVAMLVFKNGNGLTINFDAVLIVLAMVSSAVFYVTQRRLVKYYPPLTLTALTMVGGTLLFLPFFPGTLEGLEGITTRSSLAILYLGVGIIVPYVGWAYVLSKLEVGKAVPYLYLIPLVSTFLGWWILDEAVTLNLLFSGALILLGVMIGNGIIKGWPIAKRPKIRPVCSLPTNTECRGQG